MSLIGEEVSTSSSSSRDYEDEGCEEGEDGDGRCRCKAKDGKKLQGSSGIGFTRNFRKVKQVVMSSLTPKGKKQLPRRNRGVVSSCGSSFGSGKKFGVGGGNGGCYLCFMPALNVDSKAEPPSSDPNSPNFGFGKLRSLIEKNDFYSRECNYHLDFDPELPSQRI